MRYKYLDVAKGISLLFVLMAHSCGFPFGLGGYCTAYFMALFFIVSGYTRAGDVKKSIKPDKTYIYRRVKKIVFPYFFYNILIFFLFFIWKGFENTREAFLAVIGVFYSTYCLHFPIEDTDFFCYRIYNNATWFLTAFFCADILFILYRKYCNETRRKVAVFIAFAVITQMLYYCPFFFPWNMDKAFIGADFMILGYERKNRLETEAERISVIRAMLFVIIYVFLVDFNPGINLATREYGNKGIFSVGLYLVIGYVGSMLCIWGSIFISKIPFVGDVFALLGKEALPVMAMHLIIYQIFDQILYMSTPAIMESPQGWDVAFLRISVTCVIIIGVIYGMRYVGRKKRKEI